MVYYPDYRVWCSPYEQDPYRIEWIYFEEGSALHLLIQTVPHVCFIVEDIQKAVKGKKILLQPTLIDEYWTAFIEEKGTPIEFFSKA